MGEKTCIQALTELGLDATQVTAIKKYMETNQTQDPEITEILKELKNTDYEKWVEYKPSLVR